MNTAESLDEIISAHEEFLGTLVARALLDDRSRDVLTQLRAIYDRILEFQTIANRIHDDAVEEVNVNLILTHFQIVVLSVGGQADPAADDGQRHQGRGVRDN